MNPDTMGKTTKSAKSMATAIQVARWPFLSLVMVARRADVVWRLSSALRNRTLALLEM